MIVAKDLTLLRGGRPLFEHASFAIHPGWRVGLIWQQWLWKKLFI